MKRKIYVPTLAALMGIASQASFAQQTAVGPGIIPLNATGTVSGVSMSASGVTGTLSVGVPGGPPADIFTLNNPVVP
ncbi:MAG: hypothetical protein WCP77_00820 [Roseococcus sp.]